MRTTTSGPDTEYAGGLGYGRSGGTRRTGARIVVAVALALVAGTVGPAGADDAGPTAPEAAGPDGATTLTAHAMTAPSTGAPDLLPSRSADDRAEFEPNLRSGLTPPIVKTVRLSFRVAVRRAASNPSCTQLFEALDAAPSELLSRTLYYAAPNGVAAPPCRMGANAFTAVGSPVTYLCPAFGSLPTEQAAFVLIHEALHYAGMTEKPQDENARTSSEINDLVKVSCRL
jgi:hypothetical protein